MTIRPAHLLCGLLALAMVRVAPLAAQLPVGAAPNTDIYLADLTTRDGHLVVGAPRNLTARVGYDNQPAFTPAGDAILYTSRRDGQTDIWKYDLARGTAAPVAQTPESEYSPTVTPDGRTLSVVRVERDSAQRLWRFTPDGRAAGVLFERLKPVGYHLWIDPGTLYLYVLGTPATLQRADLASGEATIVDRGIGRWLARVPGGREISYLRRPTGGPWTQVAMDPSTGAVRELAPALPGQEHYAWTPDGVLLGGDGSRLMAWNADARSWILVADLATQGVNEISRLAVSPDGHRLAIVAADPQ